MRFGKDSYGNLYLASKTNKKLYRLQGTPELTLQAVDSSARAGSYFEFFLERPPADESITYRLEVSDDLASGFLPAEASDCEVVSTRSLANGKERVTFRYMVPVEAGHPRFFRFSW